MSTIAVGNDTWLTATPVFASGVNSRQHAELKNAGLFTVQVNANRENLLNEAAPRQLGEGCWVSGFGLLEGEELAVI